MVLELPDDPKSVAWEEPKISVPMTAAEKIKLMKQKHLAKAHSHP